MTRKPARADSEALALELWVVLSRAHRAVAEHVKADVGCHALTPATFGILEALHHKGPMLLGELQQKVLVSSGGMTYLVDRLVGQGFVVRQACEEDRRAVYAALTDEGEALIRRIFPAHAKRIAEAVAGLDDADKRTAIDLLRRLGLAAEAAEAERA